MMLGIADSTAIIASLPWLMPAFPILLIAIVFMFKNGDSIGAAANGVLTGMTMCQNMIKGSIILLYMTLVGEVPAELLKSFDLLSGGAFITSSVFLMSLVYINFKAGKKISALFVCFPAIGFFLLGLSCFGINPILGLAGSIFLVSYAFWLLYSGIAMTLECAFNKKILPY